MLHKPDAGQSLQVSVHPGQTYVCDFFTDTVTFDQDNADVQLLFEDGAQIFLRDFLRVAKQEDFVIELPDGAQLSGRDVADAMNMVLQDFHTDALAAEGASDQDGGDDDASAGSSFTVAQGHSGTQHPEDLTALLEPDGGEFAPLCGAYCAFSGGHAPVPSFEGRADQDGPCITPHVRPPGDAVLSGYSEGDTHGGFSLLAPHRSTAAIEGEVLQIEDLLDISRPGSFDSARHTPAFEGLLDPLPANPPSTPTSAPSFPQDNLSPSSQSDAADSVSDQLLLAFWVLGTF